jgi:Tfp pilus assembly protein PilV
MRRGVTLFEILMAGVILAIGLLGGLEVIARCAATSRGAEDRARALMAARSKMEEILKEPVLQVGTDQGQGVDETTDYDWQAVIEETQNPSLVSITVAAQNRVTSIRAVITCLRRPDLETPPAYVTENAAAAETGTDAGTAAGGAPL